MLKARQLPWLLALVIALPSWGDYCTTKNWETGKKLYGKHEDAYNVQVDMFNEAVTRYNDFEFIAKQFGSERLAYNWQPGNPLFTALANHYRSSLMEQARAFDQVIADLKPVIKGLDKSRRLWKRLADYCQDEGESADYEGGRHNMKKSIETLNKAHKLKSRSEKLKLKYLTEAGRLADAERQAEARRDTL